MPKAKHFIAFSLMNFAIPIVLWMLYVAWKIALKSSVMVIHKALLFSAVNGLSILYIALVLVADYRAITNPKKFFQEKQKC